AVIQGLKSGSGDLPSHIREELLDKARVVRESVVSFVESPARGSLSDSRTQRRDRSPRSERPEQMDESSPDQRLADRNRSGRDERRSNRRSKYRIVRPDFVDLALINQEG